MARRRRFRRISFRPRFRSFRRRFRGTFTRFRSYRRKSPLKTLLPIVILGVIGFLFKDKIISLFTKSTN